jgi:hypothetical protein
VWLGEGKAEAVVAGDTGRVCRLGVRSVVFADLGQMGEVLPGSEVVEPFTCSSLRAR